MSDPICNQSGTCCKRVFFDIGLQTEDIIRWINLHENMEYVEKGRVRIDNKCSKFIDNKCSIYETKPENCKKFFCEDAIRRGENI